MEGLEKLTLENLFENREVFQNICKEKNMYQYDYNRLVKTKSKKRFMRIIGDNFSWIYENVCKFGLIFDTVSDFMDGTIAKFTKGTDSGYIVITGKELQFEEGYHPTGGIQDGLIRVCFCHTNKYGLYLILNVKDSDITDDMMNRRGW